MRGAGMATGARITGLVTRWWWVRHAPVPNPEARCYGQSDKDCDVSNQALFEHQARLLPKGAVWCRWGERKRAGGGDNGGVCGPRGQAAAQGRGVVRLEPAAGPQDGRAA